MSKVIVVGNNKGGVAKTTTAVNLAKGLAISIFEYDPKGKVALAYQSLTDEVLANE